MRTPPDWDDEPDHYTASAAGALLGISAGAFRAMASNRKLPRIQQGANAYYAQAVVRIEWERRNPPEIISASAHRTTPQAESAHRTDVHLPQSAQPALLHLAQMLQEFNTRAHALEDDARRKDEMLLTAQGHAAKLLSMVTERDAALREAQAQIARLTEDSRRASESAAGEAAGRARKRFWWRRRSG